MIGKEAVMADALESVGEPRMNSSAESVIVLTRPPGRKPLDPAVIEQVVARTAEDPPGETTHWTAGLTAKAARRSIVSITEAQRYRRSRVDLGAAQRQIWHRAMRVRRNARS
jgi:hypothetical protein